MTSSPLGITCYVSCLCKENFLELVVKMKQSGSVLLKTNGRPDSILFPISTNLVKPHLSAFLPKVLVRKLIPLLHLYEYESATSCQLA